MYLPDLPRPQVPLPMVRLLAPELVQLLLSFLDAGSLATCEASWPSFLDASNSSGAWVRLLALDFPDSAEAGKADDADEPLQGRRLYARLARLQGRRPQTEGYSSLAPASKGLVLRQGRPDSCQDSC
jgi:hypothetical protein